MTSPPPSPVCFLIFILPHKAVSILCFFLLFQAIGYTIIYKIILQLHICNLEERERRSNTILIEFSIETRKWLCIGLYKPPSQNDKYFLDNLSLILNKLNCQFDNIMLMGDFSLTVEKKNLEVFMSTFDLDFLIKNLHVFNPLSQIALTYI